MAHDISDDSEENVQTKAKPCFPLLIGCDHIWHLIAEFACHCSNYCDYDSGRSITSLNNNNNTKGYWNLLLLCKASYRIMACFDPFLLHSLVHQCFQTLPKNRDNTSCCSTKYPLPSLDYLTNEKRRMPRPCTPGQYKSLIQVLENSFCSIDADQGSTSTDHSQYILALLKLLPWRVEDLMKSKLVSLFPEVNTMVTSCGRIHVLLDELIKTDDIHGNDFRSQCNQVCNLLKEYSCYRSSYHGLSSLHSRCSDLVTQLTRSHSPSTALLGEAIFWTSLSLRDAPNELKNNREFVLKSIRYHDGNIIQYASGQLRNDRQVVSRAVRVGDKALKFASHALRNDRKIVLMAVTHHGTALQYASSNLRNDKEIVMRAVTSCGMALKCVGNDEFKKDRSIVMKAIEQNGNVCRLISDESFWKDRDFVSKALCADPSLIAKVADPVLQRDEELVEMCLLKDSSALLYASPELFLRRLKLKQPMHLRWLPAAIRDNREVMLEAVKESSYVLLYVSEALKSDREFILSAVKIHGMKALDCIEDLTLKNDCEILAKAYEK